MDWAFDHPCIAHPVLGIIQSSGTGKTRLGRELARCKSGSIAAEDLYKGCPDRLKLIGHSKILTLFIEFREFAVQGFPLSTPFLQDYLQLDRNEKAGFYFKKFVLLLRGLLDVSTAIFRCLRRQEDEIKTDILFDIMSGISYSPPLPSQDPRQISPRGVNHSQTQPFLRACFYFFDAGPCIFLQNCTASEATLLDPSNDFVTDRGLGITWGNLWYSVIFRAQNLIKETKLDQMKAETSCEVLQWILNKEQNRETLMINSKILNELRNQFCGESSFLSLVFFMDEASDLFLKPLPENWIDFMPLRCLKYASRLFLFRDSVHGGISFLMSGTQGKSSIISPSISEVDSFQQLFPHFKTGSESSVFWQLDTFHLFETKVPRKSRTEESASVSKPVLTKEDLDSFSFLVSIGRPLWSTVNPDSLEDTATMKLFRTLVPDKVLRSPESQAFFASLAVRLGLDIDPRSELSRTLVSSHSRVVVHVSPDQTLLSSEYVPEPILAWISAKYLSKVSLADKVKCLNHFRQGNHLAKGFSGETMAQLLLMSAYEKSFHPSREATPLSAYRSQVAAALHLGSDDFLRYISLSQFMRQLLFSSDSSKSIIELLEKSYPLFKIRLWSFVYVQETLERWHLPLYFAIGCGIICRRNQLGIDLVIPVLLDDSKSLCCRENFGSVLVQVKNDRSMKMFDLICSLGNSFHFNDYLPSRKRSRDEKEEDYDLNPFLVIGMSLGFEYTQPGKPRCWLFPHDLTRLQKQVLDEKEREREKQEPRGKVPGEHACEILVDMDLEAKGRMVLCLVGLKETYGFDCASRWVTQMQSFLIPICDRRKRSARFLVSGTLLSGNSSDLPPLKQRRSVCRGPRSWNLRLVSR